MGFVFNDTATTEIYTLSRHDALPIWRPSSPTARTSRAPRPTARWRPTGAYEGRGRRRVLPERARPGARRVGAPPGGRDRKSTRLNSSHANISYAVFCLKKKNTITEPF